MSKTQRFLIKRCKLLATAAFSFVLGCMLTINLVPINKTCKLDNVDREFNVMKTSKLKSPELIILIMSAPHNLNRRTAIRETWLHLRFPKHSHQQPQKMLVKHYFVIGSMGLTPDDILHLTAEQSKFSDMLILPMHDDYGNLTQKLLSSFLWLHEQRDVGLNYKYVLKCDDDTFVRIDSLTHEIEQIEVMYLKSEWSDDKILKDNTHPYMTIDAQMNNKANSHRLQFYWGYFHGKAHVQTSGKWKEDDWIACDYYLPYALGGGYLLSHGLVGYFAKNSESLRLYRSEDVSVGAWLSSVDNVMRIHDRRFDTQWTSRGCQNHYLISHHLSEKQMHSLYSNVIKTGNLCDVERVKRSDYLYDWSSPPSKCCNKAY